MLVCQITAGHCFSFSPSAAVPGHSQGPSIANNQTVRIETPGPTVNRITKKYVLRSHKIMERFTKISHKTMKAATGVVGMHQKPYLITFE